MAEDATRYWRRKSEERQEDRARVAQGFKDTAAANVPSGWGADSAEANAPSAPGRSFGFRSGAAPAGGVANQRMGEAVEAGKSLGEPTSFRGGAGAPAPVGVIRGMRQTFATDTGGPQMSEFASKEQAGQAWNRARAGEALAAVPTESVPGAMGGFKEGTSPEAIQGQRDAIDAKFGTWRPEKQTGAEIVGEQARLTDAADPEKAARAGVFKTQAAGAQREEQDVLSKKVTGEFDTLMHESPYSSFDTKSNRTVFKAKDEGQYRDYLASKNVALQAGNAKAGREHFEERQLIRQYLQTQPLAPDTNVDAMISAAGQSPQVWQGLVQDANQIIKRNQPAPPATRSQMWEDFGKITGAAKEALTPGFRY